MGATASAEVFAGQVVSTLRAVEERDGNFRGSCDESESSTCPSIGVESVHLEVPGVTPDLDAAFFEALLGPAPRSWSEQEQWRRKTIAAFKALSSSHASLLESERTLQESSDALRESNDALQRSHNALAWRLSKLEARTDRTLADGRGADMTQTVRSGCREHSLAHQKCRAERGLGRVHRGAWGLRVCSFAPGLHTWAVAHATEPRRTCCGVIAPMALCLFVSMLQALVLCVICWEGSLLPCLAHDRCRLGEWCAPARSWHSDDAGYCYDCHGLNDILEKRTELGDERAVPWFHRLASSLVSMDLLQPELAQDAAVNASLQSAIVHCASTDALPNRCDYLVANRKGLVGSVWPMLVLVAILLVEPILVDMDRMVIGAGLLEHRKKAQPILLQWSVAAFEWCSFRMRAHVLPAFVPSAFFALLLMHQVTSSNLIFSGLAIVLIIVADDLLALVVLSPEARAWVQDVLDGEVAAGTSNAKDQRCGDVGGEAPFVHLDRWHLRRIYAEMLKGTIIAIVAFVEPFLGVIGSDVVALNIFGVSLTACSDVVSTIALPLGIVVLPTTMLWAFQCHWSTPWKCFAETILAPVFILCVCVVVVACGYKLHFSANV
mmetsp:Transcript_9183/g.24059  ORF Transcript_9183/g.24059 Transcript_9183/m.24059 type:complete len:607 (-) Transcript_9183:69-1889(-)|eukprot:CAMPEP_0117468672 /NCGR_PEP_ID=MMETSP0784-20121206/6298_1 /TAXON_ID=39447 /ORGANISM="" /LENGTH=606 /DNA_ID=CAMNT_0005262691 /DNA_START=53 /DNA_END=1873 /DNA_ORIENTATION=-